MITALLFVVGVIFFGGFLLYLMARIVEENREKKEKRKGESN